NTKVGKGLLTSHESGPWEKWFTHYERRGFCPSCGARRRISPTSSSTSLSTPVYCIGGQRPALLSVTSVPVVLLYVQKKSFGSSPSNAGYEQKIGSLLSFFCPRPNPN